VRLLFDVLHPGHVHFFRHLAEAVARDGGELLFTARAKDVTIELLDAFSFPYEVLTAIGGGKVGLARELVARVPLLARRVRSFRPDLLLGVMGPAIAPVGRICRVPSWVWYDTETARATNPWVYRLCDRLYLPEAYTGWAPAHARRYPGFHDLAYLHPSRFTPDPSVRQEAGLGAEEPFAVVRLVSWEASHDVGDAGFRDPVGFVRWLQQRIRVVVSGERGVPPELRPLALRLPPHRVHHLLAAATLYVGEGATMATEAGILGTPAIFVHTARLSVIEALERQWELLWVRRGQDDVQALCEGVLRGPAVARATWAARRARLLRESVDVGAYMRDELRDASEHGALGRPLLRRR
jgi:predicted glycosyltransferase